MTWEQMAATPHLPFDLHAPGINWEGVRGIIFTEQAPQNIQEFLRVGGQITVMPQYREFTTYADDRRYLTQNVVVGVRIELHLAHFRNRRVFLPEASTFEFLTQLAMDCGEIMHLFLNHFPEEQQQQAAVVVDFVENIRRPSPQVMDRAEATAHEWLLSHLEPQQREEWTQLHCITVHKPAGHRYIIYQGHSMNVSLLTEDPQRDGGPWTLCVVSADDRVPPSDQILMQYLMIRYNEKKFVETAQWNGQRPMWVDGRPMRPDHRRAPTHMEQHLFVEMRVDPEAQRQLQEVYAQEMRDAMFRYQQGLERAVMESEPARRISDVNIWNTDIGPIFTGS